MSGTMTVTSPWTLLIQASRQPSANSAWEIWLVGKDSSSPATSFTRHLPQEPLPEQGASMATFALRAASSSVIFGDAEKTTGFSPFSNWKVT